MKRETSEASKHIVPVVRAMLLCAAQQQQSNSSMTGLSNMLQKVRRSSQKEVGGEKLATAVLMAVRYYKRCCT